jgi:hypothetical protein
MTSSHLIAQAHASADPSIGRALHALSRLRGRLDVLEMAIAENEPRRRLKALLEIGDLLEEIRSISDERAAA